MMLWKGGTMITKPLYEQLIDRRTGFITRLTPAPIHPNLPRQIFSWRAQMADGFILAGIPSDRIAGGTAFNDDKARLAAIGEAVERYCGNYIGAPLLKGSYRTLTAKGYKLLDPLKVPLYSRQQYTAKGFPFVPMDRDLVMNWIEGESLTGGYRIWIPASLVYINYHQEAFRGEPQTHFVQYAGIACGATRNSAIISGLLELIERDAVAIWWGADVPLPALNVRRYPRLRSYVEPIQADSPVSFKWFPIPNDSGIPVIGSLLHDSRQHIVCMGFAARFSAEEAALKAAAEAAQSYHIALDLLDPDSPTWNAIQQGILNDKALKPYRADRSYRSAFRDDYRDMVDLYLNSQYYMDPATHTEISSLLNAEETAMLPADAAIPATMEALVHQLSSLDLEAFYADVTTPDIQDIGLCVTRAIVPGLVPNAPTAFPYLGPERLYTIPCRLGWTTGPLTEHQINRRPLPHS
ncbi:hypothetical protein CHH75_09005 [Paenibacillus sp. 7541]|uniref:YcaO domain-containing protein n=2 Tax=Paenibacillus TaxID=44249 RepID=A0ABW9SYX3_9BACL|nr:hypothetical protein [Paenibacillus campinasensis]PAK53939.1 hypothetical protein CHH75_09005 [Paenibacillus sp. 7541]